jgi:P-type Cu2+ transporter
MQSAYLALDDPQEWAAFSRALPGAPGCWESGVSLQGMTCAACALTIEAALRAVPGVLGVEVSGASQRARVRWRAAITKPSAWIQAVERAGYRVLPAMDRCAQEARRLQTRQALWRWLVAGFCMMQVMMYAAPAYMAAPGDISADAQRLLRWASWVLCLPVLLFSCGPFFRQAWRDLRSGRIGMDLPVAIGILVTFAVSSIGTFDPSGAFGREVYFDSLTMFVFFLLTGRWLEARLRERTAGALDALMNRLPDRIERQREDGSFAPVALRQIRVGDVLRLNPGEAFPADGAITQGATLVDEALLTGESRPLSRVCGAVVIAGSFNLSGVVHMRVQRVGTDTRFAQIVALMENAAVDKPRLAALADRLATPFLAAVLAAAGLACAFWWPQDPGHALMVAVAVLVVTCPCALSLATPAAMLAAAGTLARRGILLRRLQALEALARVDTVVFDKTGTLTSDVLTLSGVQCREGWRESEVLAMAAALARRSMHPVSRAIARAAWRSDVPTWQAHEVAETAGQGVAGQVSIARGPGDANGSEEPMPLRLGSAAYCGVAVAEFETLTAVLCDAQGWLATFELQETLRPDAQAAVQALRNAGLDVMLLSGDSARAVSRVAARVGIDKARGRCTPQDKLSALREVQAESRHLAMVGDGLNDGPVLAGADVSFSFGQAVPLAAARSDFVLPADRLMAVAQTISLARRSLRVVRQNLAWAAAYNAVCVPLAVVGWLPAWVAGLGMAASSLLVVGNALRLADGREFNGAH